MGFLLALAAFSDPLRVPEDCRWLDHVPEWFAFSCKEGHLETNVPKRAGNAVVTKPVAIYETEQIPLKYSVDGP